MRERPQHSQITQTKEKTCGQSEALQTDARLVRKTRRTDTTNRLYIHTYRQTDRQTDILCSVHTHILEKK